MYDSKSGSEHANVDCQIINNVFEENASEAKGNLYLHDDPFADIRITSNTGYAATGCTITGNSYYQSSETSGDSNWMNKAFVSHDLVKYDLFERYGLIAAAGDRHLAEFCPPSWYTKDPKCVHDWGFTLTTVDWREQDLQERLAQSEALKKEEKDFPWEDSGEEGVRQIQAILGLGDLITNVNIPNAGQISNLPKGLVVETNAAFAADSVQPVMAGDIPSEIYGLVAASAAAQDLVMEAGKKRDLSIAFQAFLADLHVQSLSPADAKSMFDEMIEQTKEYLGEYFL